MLLNLSGGGWGWGDDNVPCTCTHVECYSTCLGWVGWGDDNVSLHLYTCWMLRNLTWKVSIGRSVSSKNNAREVNPRLKTYVYAYMFRRICGQCMAWDWTTVQRMTTKQKKVSRSECFPKIDMGLWQNADFDSKPCVLQHFGSPPFNSITSKYCKGYKFHKKEDFKMLKKPRVVPGPVTLFFVWFLRHTGTQYFFKMLFP